MDPRAARTRRRLQEALLQLARTAGPDQISVSDVARAAGVNRSTFYQHYADVETLLADALDGQAVLAGADLSLLRLDDLGSEPPEVLVSYVRLLADNAHIYRFALIHSRHSGTADRLQHRLRALVGGTAEALGVPEPDAGVPLRVLAAGIAGMILGVLSAWLETEPLPPPELAARWVWNALLKPPPEAVPGFRTGPAGG